LGISEPFSVSHSHRAANQSISPGGRLLLHNSFNGAVAVMAFFVISDFAFISPTAKDSKCRRGLHIMLGDI
jgi:hypothetical protein